MFVNVYILLRSLLSYLMIGNSYQDISIFIFRFCVFGGYILSCYNKGSVFDLAALL